jgi:hypothetical protein
MRRKDIVMGRQGKKTRGIEAIIYRHVGFPPLTLTSMELTLGSYDDVDWEKLGRSGLPNPEEIDAGAPSPHEYTGAPPSEATEARRLFFDGDLRGCV